MQLTLMFLFHFSVFFGSPERPNWQMKPGITLKIGMWPEKYCRQRNATRALDRSDKLRVPDERRGNYLVVHQIHKALVSKRRPIGVQLDLHSALACGRLQAAELERNDCEFCVHGRWHGQGRTRALSSS